MQTKASRTVRIRDTAPGQLDAWEREMFAICTCGHRNLIHNAAQHPTRPKLCVITSCPCTGFKDSGRPPLALNP